MASTKQNMGSQHKRAFDTMRKKFLVLPIVAFNFMTAGCGRYQLVPGHSSLGTDVSLVFKIDTATGQAWIYDGERNTWQAVNDKP